MNRMLERAAEIIDPDGWDAGDRARIGLSKDRATEVVLLVVEAMRSRDSALMDDAALKEFARVMPCEGHLQRLKRACLVRDMRRRMLDAFLRERGLS